MKNSWKNLLKNHPSLFVFEIPAGQISPLAEFDQKYLTSFATLVLCKIYKLIIPTEEGLHLLKSFSGLMFHQFFWFDPPFSWYMRKTK